MSSSAVSWILFLVLLGGNIFGWGVTLLRVLLSLDGGFAKVVLAAHICVGFGLILAFVFGWMHGNEDKHRRVMLVWTASIVGLVLLSLWERRS